MTTEDSASKHAEDVEHGLEPPLRTTKVEPGVEFVLIPDKSHVQRETEWLAALTPERRAHVQKREQERLAALTVPEQIGNHLGEALMILDGLIGASTPFEDITQAEREARMAYHHVHMALKKMAKQDPAADMQKALHHIAMLTSETNPHGWEMDDDQEGGQPNGTGTIEASDSREWFSPERETHHRRVITLTGPWEVGPTAAALAQQKATAKSHEAETAQSEERTLQAAQEILTRRAAANDT